ncbi:hypothetical protein [Sutcliffiella horikoshii]|uniref:hypothetical protein n=1 Tax=Sutcliffiella horikoshii TaxID=79883 RepID=UPI001F21D483|nr:hypothetical protein [Sutcliffiella horikoshii]MCG1021478.1 hypothetical protein [Sutcliffiella horikoshii]
MEKNKTKQLKYALLQDLSERLNMHSFEKRVIGQSVIKKMEKGLISIHLMYIEHQEDLDVTVDFGIRFDEVESMGHMGNALLTKKEKKGTFTIGAELGNVRDGRQRRWTIIREGDIPAIAESMFQSIKTVILPLIDRYLEKEAVYNLCLRDDEKAVLLCPINYKRAINAVALAVIMKKDLDVISLIIKQKQDYLRKQDEFGLEIFNSFIENLELNGYKKKEKRND